ncbi:MAG: pyridoxal-phosphate dependent enzyme [Bacteroidia bacterium]|nr:pyridoxal-phosphate dependent enzyme [Bacteroidia bacterium]
MSIFNSSRVDCISIPLIGDGFPFDILRDDLIHPIVSGNKWRKLKYILKHLIEKDYKQLVTFGGAYSNHLVATAFAGREFGIKTIGFVRGDEVRLPNHYETLCIQNDMQLIHVNRTDYKDKMALFNSYFGEDADTYFIGEGGDHPLALIGCAEILDDLNKTYDFILLSMGTGTTAEGLVRGLTERKLPTHVYGISALKNNFELDIKLMKYDPLKYKVLHEYHRGKYAKSDPELIQFIREFYNQTGIKTDTVYTGKMLMALNDLIAKGTISRHHKVLCIHTGGLLDFPD